MPQIRITVKGLGQATERIRAAINRGALNGLELAGERGVQLVEENIASPLGDKPAAVSTGNLVNAIFSEFQTAPGILGRVVVAAGPPADVYAAPVETGSRPHMPPVSALLLWVQKKFGIEDEKQALSIAWAVAKTIKKRGTEGHQMFERAFEVLEDEAPGIIERGIAEEIQRRGLAPAGGP